MIQLTRRKKTIIATVVITMIILVLSIFSPLVHSEADSNFTLPCIVNTYGNAWNGALAFDLSGAVNASVVMNTDGTLLNIRESAAIYGGATYNIATDTLMFQGEPSVEEANTVWENCATHFWNFNTNSTEDFPNVIGEHDIQYDPINGTFLTLQDYVEVVENNSILLDKIVQFDPNGDVIWSWDTQNYIPLSEASPFNETTKTLNGQTVMDFTHANDLYWDYNQSIIYLNLRNTNTFYKINQTTGDIIWACGEFGNFTLLGGNGQAVSSLWYHSHDTKEVAPDVFTMFDNDYENNTDPDNCHSQMLEVTLNETSMTAYVNWSWEAPTQYWNTYGGATVILPNGDFLGDFGDPTHQFSQNQPWNFNNTGAVFVEVNPAGQVVRTWAFPVGWYSYRVEAVTNSTLAFTPTPTPTVTPSPTPSTLPTSTPSTSISTNPTPPKAINSQTVYETLAVTAVILIIIGLGFVIYLKKAQILTKLMKKKR
jgi:hypothetical protein